MRKHATPLDPEFISLAAEFIAYRDEVRKAERKQLFAVRVYRAESTYSSYSMDILPESVQEERTLRLLDRLVKSLLWIRGGYKMRIAGSKAVFTYLKQAYREGGTRSFDANFMSTVYERPFEVQYETRPENLLASAESASAVGKHLNGCRIGFDAGGSDRKVSAVIDGETVYSEEVIWHPKTQADPGYHEAGILSAFRSAAAHLPRVDGIGVSSAGVYVNNKAMVASLFLKVPPAQFESKVKNIYINAAKEFGPVPLVVANDGDVTALAGAMSLGSGRILGIAMGTSEAGGYVDEQMRITGWLNELAFVPVDLNGEAPLDEWSGDIGCGVKYFSQDAVIRLAPAAGIDLSGAESPADKLKDVQQALAGKQSGARMIFETIGMYFAHAIAWYALFFDISKVLVMGRVTSGEGGEILVETAIRTLKKAFPELASGITISLPDEKSRRVGQSIAAASLPEVP